MSELSASLILEFQYRGDADHSKEVKKAFVSAFLTAEEKVEPFLNITCGLLVSLFVVICFFTVLVYDYLH